MLCAWVMSQSNIRECYVSINERTLYCFFMCDKSRGKNLCYHMKYFMHIQNQSRCNVFIYKFVRWIVVNRIYSPTYKSEADFSVGCHSWSSTRKFTVTFVTWVNNRSQNLNNLWATCINYAALHQPLSHYLEEVAK